MTTESVNILVSAQDEASAKLFEIQKQTDANVRSIKEVGGQSKASAELVGTLANSLGGAAFGSVAGEIAMLTERASAFSEVMKTGSAGALAFAAGATAITAVISVKAGQAIGDIIFQTEKWNQKLEENLQLYNEIGNELEQRFIARLRDQLDVAIKLAEATGNAANLDEVQNTLRREQLGLETQLASAISKKREAEEAYFQTAVTASTIEKANADIARVRNEIKALREMQVQATAQAVQDAKAAQIIEEQNKRRERGSDIIRAMTRDLAILRASEEDRQRLQMAAKGLFGEDQIQQAIALQKQITELQDEELRKAEAIKQAERDRIAALKETQQVERNRISELQRQIALIENASVASAIGDVTATDQRALSGRAGGSFRKSVAEAEAEKQTTLQDRLVKLNEQIARSLKIIETTEAKIKVIGD